MNAVMPKGALHGRRVLLRDGVMTGDRKNGGGK